MKIFQTIEKNFALIGFIPNDRQKLKPIHIGIVAVFAVNVILLFLYIFLTANSIEEYMDVTFSLTIAIGGLIAFIRLISEKDKAFNTIELCDKELNESN